MHPLYIYENDRCDVERQNLTDDEASRYGDAQRKPKRRSLPSPEYERRRGEFKARRDWFIPQLDAMGLKVPVLPDGAFYAWVDCSQLCRTLGVDSSWELAFELMQRAHVAVTPGRDFGTAQTRDFIRFSTANSMAQLQEAAARLRALAA